MAQSKLEKQLRRLLADLDELHELREREREDEDTPCEESLKQVSEAWAEEQARRFALEARIGASGHEINLAELLRLSEIGLIVETMPVQFSLQRVETGWGVRNCAGETRYLSLADALKILNAGEVKSNAS
jgi:hypothetical protein